MKKRKQGYDFLKKFIHHKPATISAILIIIEILAVIFLPMILPLDPYTSDPLAFNAPPGGAHLLGTDDIGRDILARLIYGGRNSLAIGVLSTIISILVGLPLGLLAGYYRGIWETIVMRAADIFMSFPSMILILVVVAIFEPTVFTIAMVIGVLGWPAIGKLIYGNVLSVRKKDYVEAAKSIGTKESEIIFKYVLPNSIAPLWMSVAFRISSAMITMATLSSVTDMKYKEYQNSYLAENDEEAAKAIFGEYLEYIHEQVPVVFLVGTYDYTSYTKRMGDITQDILASSLRDPAVYNWKVTK